MDAVGLGWVIAPTITGLLLAVPGFLGAPSMTAWACFSASFLPIFFIALWSVPKLPRKGARMFFAGLVGAVTGTVLSIGLVEMLHTKASAQISETAADKPTPQEITNNQGIITFGQTGDNTLNVYGPVKRQLEERQTAAIANTIKGAGISVLVTAPDNPEVRAYEQQIVQALFTGGIDVRPWNIGTISPPPYGVQMRPNGHDPAPLITALKAGGANPRVVDYPILVPASVRQQYAGFIGLVIGFREE